MGRHSASYISAQREHRPEAAAYVGRVGALALALGLGAAVAGGTGIAHAEGTEDGGTGGATQQAAPNTPKDSDPAEPAGQSSAPGSVASGASTPGPTHSTDVPKMQLGNGRETTPSATTPPKSSGGNAPGSLPDLIASIPQRIAAALTPHPAASTTPTSSPTSNSSTPQRNSPADPKTNAAPTPTISGPAPTDSPFVRRLSDAASAAIRGDVDTLGVVPSHATTTVGQKLVPSTPDVALAVSNSVAAAAVTAVQVAPAPANPIATVVSNVLSALGLAPTVGTGGSPTAPFPIVHAVLQLVRRELDLLVLNLSLTLNPTNPAFAVVPTSAVLPNTPGTPAFTDDVPTAYGDIGKWMLQSNGQISNYGGVPYGGKTVLEPVNVIIVDPNSTSTAEAANKLNAAMFWSGFPAQPIHSTGFSGRIDDQPYGQQPTGPLLGYSDGLFIFPNDHGRIFGPDPVQTDQGFVWSGAFSTEQLVLNGFSLTHGYVSSNAARNALAVRLILSGQATYGGVVPLNNAYNTATTTTGDHDGYAVVLVLK